MGKGEQDVTKLCEEFGKILDSTSSFENGVCLATRSRTNLKPTVLGRRADSFMYIPQAFSFENLDSQGRALCLGETVILESEINPFLTRLRKHGIIVTAIHNHWLFDEPRLMYMHFESIDQPLSFAKKVRDALRVLTSREIVVPRKTKHTNKNQSKLCDTFSEILDGDMHTFENGQCIVMRDRNNIRPVVLGRRGQSFLLVPQMFTFESMTKDGKALCAGETVILEDEINPFISKLREHDIIVTAVHNHWLFDDPRLMYMHFVKIDEPLHFAEDVSDALKVLTDAIVQGSK